MDDIVARLREEAFGDVNANPRAEHPRIEIDDYIEALERAVRERLAVNVGLIRENDDLKRRLAP